MAPRGRTRKPRLTRMDAAIDAMGPYGFAEEIVRRKVKDLLKEYGGDDGWPFIEADAYQVLVDTILEEQDNEDKAKLLDEPPRDEGAGDISVAADAGPSGLVLALTNSEDADAVVQTVNATDAGPSGGRFLLLPAERERKGWKDISLDSPPPVISSPLPVNSLPTRRRKPCYGWISSDDEDDDFIELTPAVRSTRTTPPPAQSENTISGTVRTDRRQKRKTRWDVRPGDLKSRSGSPSLL